MKCFWVSPMHLNTSDTVDQAGSKSKTSQERDLISHSQLVLWFTWAVTFFFFFNTVTFNLQCKAYIKIF